MLEIVIAKLTIHSSNKTKGCLLIKRK